MAAVPYSGGVPSVEPQVGVPNDYQNIRSTPAEFGGLVGQGEEALGTGALKASRFYGEVAADDATNKWQEEVNKKLYGDPDVQGDQGFFGLRGEDALLAMPQVQQDINNLREKYRGGLLTSEQSLTFDRQTQRLQSFLTGEVGRHYENQFTTYQAATNKASADLALHGISANANDPVAVKNFTGDLMSAYLKDATGRYGQSLSNDIVYDAQARARSDATAQQIRALARTDPGRALGVMKESGDALLGPAKDQLTRELAGVSDGMIAANAVHETRGGAVGVPRGLVAPSTISSIATESNVSPALANATAAIESGHGSNTGNRISPSNTGVYQMAPADSPGGANDTLENQVRLGVGKLAEERDGLRASLGREPSNAEVYLAHQQGVAGATRLINNPNTPAGQLVRPVAISNNGGDPTQPASAFVGNWAQRYAHIESRFAGAETQVAQSTPPGIPGPGIDQLSQMQSARAQRYASELTAIEQRPDLIANPRAMQMATQQVQRDYQRDDAILTGQMKAIQEHRNAVADGFVQRIMKTPDDPAIIDDLAQPNNGLDATSRENLERFRQVESKKVLGGDVAKYGGKFFDAYQQIHSDGPDKLRDPSQIYQLAVPHDDGTQDLTLAGAEKLVGELRGMQRDPENAGMAKVQQGVLAYAKHQLSLEKDYGTYKVRDPKGEDAFNIGFTPAFFGYWEKGLAAGKTPQELASKAEIDKLVEPFKRNPAELMQDQMNIGIDTPANSAAARREAADAYLRAHPELRGAYDQKFGSGASDAILGGQPVPQATAPIPPQ